MTDDWVWMDSDEKSHFVKDDESMTALRDFDRMDEMLGSGYWIIVDTPRLYVRGGINWFQVYVHKDLIDE